MCILGKYIQNRKIKIKYFETYFWSKFLSRAKIFRVVLDLLEDPHCNLQWESSSKSKKNLKFLVRDKNFDQKYVSIFLYIFSKYAHNKLRHHPSNPTTLAGGRVFKTTDFASYQVFIANVFNYDDLVYETYHMTALH